MTLSPTVLVVEDEAILRDLVVEALAEHGFPVLQAATSDAALALIAGPQSIDLLFTDIRLPGTLDGWTLAERYREAHPRGGVVYATGYSPAAPRQVRGGLFFAKPYRVADVIKALTELAAAGARGGPEAPG